MQPPGRKTKVTGAIHEALERGEKIRSGDFSREHGMARQSVGLALQKMWERNDDVARDKEGNTFVYYVIRDSAVPAGKKAARAALKEQAIMEETAWDVLWESPDRMLIEADGRQWWATPLA